VSAAGHTAEACLVTAEGYECLRSTLEHLCGDRRRAMSERLRRAREDGDLAENPARLSLLEEHGRLEHQIALLEEQLATARIAEPTGDGTAGIGTRVWLREASSGDHLEFALVGSIESDAAAGRLSADAPVGRALLGRRAGAIVDVATPRGTLRYEILNVAPLDSEAASRRRAA
jgi:transcription elongation factor GreA